MRKKYYSIASERFENIIHVKPQFTDKPLWNCLILDDTDR